MPHLHALATQLIRLTLWLGILAAIFVPLERAFTLRRSVGRTRTLAEDIGFFFVNALVPVMILAPPLALLSQAFHALWPASYLDAVARLPIWAKLGLGLLLGEIGGYWAHRLSHEAPILWRFHSLHHAPRHVDWLVSSRAHPVDQVFTKLCALAPLYAFGLTQPSGGGFGLGAAVAVFGLVWGFFIHANVRWRLGPVEQLISSPAFHHWHHTSDARRDGNYAALFPWVDRLFGTLHLPRTWPEDYGLYEAAEPAAEDRSRSMAG
jgi:sterol desaturase/sphingolipid hydroxylase (fatty acid hydroxylase superfamily)